MKKRVKEIVKGIMGKKTDNNKQPGSIQPSKPAQPKKEDLWKFDEFFQNIQETGKKPSENQRNLDIATPDQDSTSTIQETDEKPGENQRSSDNPTSDQDSTSTTGAKSPTFHRSVIDSYVLECRDKIAEIYVKEGDLEILKDFVSHYGIQAEQNTVRFAAENGDIKMLKYLIDDLKLTPDQDALTGATENRKLRTVQFLTKKHNIKPDQDLVRIAAENEDLGMLKYLIDVLGLMPDEDALIAAIENQNIKILTWLIMDKGMKLDISGVAATLQKTPNPEFMELCFTKNSYLKIDYSELDAKSFDLTYFHDLQKMAQETNLTPLEILPEIDDKDVTTLIGGGEGE
jgi:hypothetical protein